MFKAPFYTVMVALATFSCCDQIMAQDTFRAMMRRVPSSANAVVLINVAKILQSPVAVKENWKDRQEKAFEAGLSILPPGVSRFVQVSQIDYEFMEPMWETSVMNFYRELDPESFASKHRLHLETIGDMQALALPSDKYVVQLGPQQAAIYAPGNRQSVVRWIRDSRRRKEHDLSPYLAEAVRIADDVGTEVMMAMDLEGIATPQAIRSRLENLEAARNIKVDLDAASDYLASIRGVTLGISFRRAPVGALKVEFAASAAMSPENAKAALLEVLGKRGAMIDDFNDWKPKADGSRLQISGPMSETGLRQIFSIFEAPHDAYGLAQQDSTGEEQADPQYEVVQKSQTYFKSITGYLGDLRNKKGAKSVGQYGTWFSNYARRIDRLPILNVDSDLLDYGRYTSENLRNAAQAIQQVGIQSGARTAQVLNTYRYGRYGSYWGGAWGAERNDQQGERRAIRAEERAKGATSSRQIMQDIENATADIRRTMTERYQVEF